MCSSQIAAELYRKPDGSYSARNAAIHVATFQTLDFDSKDGSGSFLAASYPPDYFSHIVIHECHRWGKWSEVLRRNASVVQIGLTATPRQLEALKEAALDLKLSADNLKYFGEPACEYDIAQGNEDGYPAACEIQKGSVNLDDTGITIDEILARNPTGAITGARITRAQLDQLYQKTDYQSRPSRASGERLFMGSSGVIRRAGKRPFVAACRRARIRNCFTAYNCVIVCKVSCGISTSGRGC
jgi:type I restriction enzyme R subunit